MRCKGQASVEYVAAVTLIAVVLAGAGALVAMPDLPATVVHHVRVALCIVSGDVCRASDARLAGLEPCTLRSRRTQNDRGATIGFVRLGSSGGAVIEQRSDGSYRVSIQNGGSVDATTGLSLHLGPYVTAGADISSGAGFAAGRTWEVRDDAALRRLFVSFTDREVLLHGEGGSLPEPTYRYWKADRHAAAGLSAQLGGARANGGMGWSASVSARQALGHRSGPDGTTWFFDLGEEAAGPLASLVPGLAGEGSVLAEVRPGDPSTLTLRRGGAGAAKGEVVERSATLALIDDADRDAVRAFVLEQAAGVAGYKAGVDLARRIEARGRVEVTRYAEDDASDELDATLKAGVGIGFDHTHSVISRRLVDSYVDGPRRARRADCLGL